jgi:3-hydroxyisobutyrate dehydrogenase-like beta-hydroxyacid dehydrogenase
MSETPATLGFIGLGVMGSGMCANLVRKHDGPVHVFDMNPDAVARMVDVGAVAAQSVEDVAAKAGVIFLSLPGGKQVLEVCETIAAAASPGTIVADLSTTTLNDARAAAALLQKAGGIHFADAPVARTRQAAIDGTLSIMVGGDQALFARLEPLLRTMGSDVTLCGATGCGQVVKLINNTLLFEQVAAIAEMMVVAERAGVAAETLIETVGLGSGNSFALQNHGRKAMAPRDFPVQAFPSTYALKDLGYAMDLAGQFGVNPRVARLAAEYYREATEAGIGEKYFPAIIELIDRQGEQTGEGTD